MFDRSHPYHALAATLPEEKRKQKRKGKGLSSHNLRIPSPDQIKERSGLVFGLIFSAHRYDDDDGGGGGGDDDDGYGDGDGDGDDDDDERRL